MTWPEFHMRRLEAEWDYQQTKLGDGKWVIFAVLDDGSDSASISTIGWVKYEAYAAEIVRLHNAIIEALKEPEEELEGVE